MVVCGNQMLKQRENYECTLNFQCLYLCIKIICLKESETKVDASGINVLKKILMNGVNHAGPAEGQGGDKVLPNGDAGLKVGSSAVQILNSGF